MDIHWQLFVEFVPILDKCQADWDGGNDAIDDCVPQYFSMGFVLSAIVMCMKKTPTREGR